MYADIDSLDVTEKLDMSQIKHMTHRSQINHSESNTHDGNKTSPRFNQTTISKHFKSVNNQKKINKARLAVILNKVRPRTKLKYKFKFDEIIDKSSLVTFYQKAFFESKYK